MFAESLVAIDGSKFKAVNNSNKNYTQGKVKSRLAQIETSIDRYFKQIASADRYDTPEVKGKKVRLKDKIKKLEEEIEHLNEIKIELANTPDKQTSLTDPDVRSMTTSD